MRGIWNRGLQPRHAVILLALVIGIALSVLVAYDHYRDYVAEIEAAGLKTRNLTRLLEEHARQSLRRVELGVIRAAGASSAAGGAAAADPDALRQRLSAFLPPDGLIRLFAVVDRDGSVVLSTQAEDVHGVTVADRDYFLAQRERAGRGMVFGAAAKSRVTGKWTLPVSHRLDAPGGAFQGVLLAMVDPAYFQAFYDSIDTGANGFVALFQRQGGIVARSPYDEQVLTRNWSGSPMFRVHLPASEINTVRQVVAADSVERIYSYRALKDYPVVVSLGLSLSDILAAWRERTWRDGIFLLITLAALGSGALALTRQLLRRENAETVSRENEARFRSLTALSSDWYWEQDENHRFTFMSGDLDANTGIDSHEHIGKTRWELPALNLTEPDWTEHRALLGRHEPFHDFEMRRPDQRGRMHWVSISGEPTFDATGRFTGYHGVGRDITGRKQNEVALRGYAEHLETLSRRVLTVQEDERRFLARELHDEIGQALTAVKLNLQSLRASHVAAELRSSVDESLEVVDTTIAQVRSLSLDLRPQILDDLGIVAALRWYCRRAAERSGLRVDFKADPVNLAHVQTLATVCYRVVQEAVTNALRHARATNVRVELRAQGGRLRLSIEDDGAGMDLEARRAAAHAGESSGLPSMEERAALVGGRLQLFSQPGKGTRVVAEFQLEETHAAA